MKKKKNSIFTRQTEGDKILKSIIKDIEENNINVTKGSNFTFYSKNALWQYLSIKNNTLTIRDIGIKAKAKNKHYQLSEKTVELFTDFHNNF